MKVRLDTQVVIKNNVIKPVPIKKKQTVWNDIVNDGKIYLQDMGAYVISPFRMNGSEYAWAAGMVGITALSMQFDLKARKYFDRGTDATFNHDFWDFPTVYGFVQYPSIAAGLMYVTGLATRNNWIRVTARLWLEALSYSGGAVMLLRWVTGRTRPYYSDNPFKYTWFQPKNDTQSFPSGHIVVAFATSTILAERIDNWYVRIGLYSLAALTGYARLINNQHWLSDVIAGAVLGFTSAYFVMNREWNREEELTKSPQQTTKPKGKSGGKFSLYPSLLGLNLVYRF